VLAVAGIYDPTSYAFPVAIADKDLQCWTQEHLNIVWPALCALCVYFPSATLTTAIKYSPEEDIRYVFLYNRLELITKGLMLFLSLSYANEPIIGLFCLMLGSCVVIMALHYMRPSCQKLAMRWKYFVHCSNIWTCLTCIGALHFQIDHTNWQYHLQAAGAGWGAIFIVWSLNIWRNEQQDVMNAPVDEPTTSARACREIDQLRHDIGYVTGPPAWGKHALILRLLEFAAHESLTVRVRAFESLAVLSYWDHITSEAFFIEMTPNTAMLLVINAITTEQDQTLLIFAIRVLGAFVRAELHIKELSRFIEQDNGVNLPQSIAKLACSTCRRESQVDCMQTILAITYVDSNTLDAVAEHCIPMLAEWAQKGSLIEQHLAAEIFMLISGRFDHTSELIAQGALPKLVSLFMSVDDIEVNPKSLKVNRSTGFRSGCLQPERAVVIAHQVPHNLRQAFQRIYPRVKHIYHEKDDESYEQTAHRADRREWGAWVNSGMPLAIEIKQKLTAREFEGVSRVKSAGVTRQHLNELFDIMYNGSDAGSSNLTEGTLDGRTIATFLSGYGLGDTDDIEKVLYDTGIYQHGIGEVDDNDIQGELPRELFCRWLLMSMPDTDALLQGQEVDTGSLALRVLQECMPHSRDADCDTTLLKRDVESFYDEMQSACSTGENPEAKEIVLRISHVARYLVESKQLGIGTCEEVESAMTIEITAGEADVDAHVQLSTLQLQIMKDEITKATVHTLTEIAMAQGAQGRADMVDGGVLVIISRCFKLFKPPEVHALALNMLHALMNGRFSEKDIAHDADLIGFFSEINEYKAQLERDENASPLLRFEGLTALERRKAHMMAAFLGMYHRSIGSPVNRKVIVSQMPITEDITWQVVRADTDDDEVDDEVDDERSMKSSAAMAGKDAQRFVNPIADELDAPSQTVLGSADTLDSDAPDIIVTAAKVPGNEFPDEMAATNDDKALATAILPEHHADILQEEDAIFESSREKIANTGITSAVRTVFPFSIWSGCSCSLVPSLIQSWNRTMYSCFSSLMLIRRLASLVRPSKPIGTVRRIIV
jgi:hypothetical protein